MTKLTLVIVSIFFMGSAHALDCPWGSEMQSLSDGQKKTDWCVSDGNRQGPYVIYENDVVIEKGVYLGNRRNGEYQRFESGRKVLEGRYENDLMQGKWTEYHDNGKIKSLGRWKNNKPVGVWQFYSSTGKLIREWNRDKETATTISRMKTKTKIKIRLNEDHWWNNWFGQAVHVREAGLDSDGHFTTFEGGWNPRVYSELSYLRKITLPVSLSVGKSEEVGAEIIIGLGANFHLGLSGSWVVHLGVQSWEDSGEAGRLGIHYYSDLEVLKDIALNFGFYRLGFDNQALNSFSVGVSY